LKLSKDCKTFETDFLLVFKKLTIFPASISKFLNLSKLSKTTFSLLSSSSNKYFTILVSINFSPKSLSFIFLYTSKALYSFFLSLKSLNLKKVGIDNLIPTTLAEKELLKEFLQLKEHKINLDGISLDLSDRKKLYNALEVYKNINDNDLGEKLIETNIVKYLFELEESKLKVVLDNFDKFKNLDIEAGKMVNFLKTNKKSVSKVLQSLESFNQNEIKALNVMLDNIKVIPSTVENDLNLYIKYYATVLGITFILSSITFNALISF
jgi:hypothetical protein